MQEKAFSTQLLRVDDNLATLLRVRFNLQDSLCISQVKMCKLKENRLKRPKISQQNAKRNEEIYPTQSISRTIEKGIQRC